MHWAWASYSSLSFILTQTTKMFYATSNIHMYMHENKIKRFFFVFSCLYSVASERLWIGVLCEERGEEK